MPYKWEPAYRDERNKLIDGEQDYSKSYDKYLLTLSGGALALSITFIHDIVGDGPVRAAALVVWAWISFTLSVAAALVCIHQSGPLFRGFRDILDRNAQHAGDTFSWTQVRNEQSKCRRLVVMDWLSYGSLVLFLLGVILLLSFTGCNLTGETSVTEKAQPESKVVIGGRKPALAPVDVERRLVSPVPDGELGKPPLAPVKVAPPSTPPAEAAPTQPTQTEPAVKVAPPSTPPAEAAPTQPRQTEPAVKVAPPSTPPAEAAPTQPTQTEPAPSQPAPSEPSGGED